MKLMKQLEEMYDLIKINPILYGYSMKVYIFCLKLLFATRKENLKLYSEGVITSKLVLKIRSRYREKQHKTMCINVRNPIDDTELETSKMFNSLALSKPEKLKL